MSRFDHGSLARPPVICAGEHISRLSGLLRIVSHPLERGRAFHLRQHKGGDDGMDGIDGLTLTFFVKNFTSYCS